MTKQTPIPHRILIVDDEAPVRELLAEVLGSEYECVLADSAEKALATLASGDFAAVISDIDMPGISGLDMVPQMHEIAPDTVILMVSGNLAIDYAVKAIRVGAFDYITKPFELEAVEGAVKRAIEHHQALIKKKRYESELEDLVKQRTEELNFLIYYDSLTNLPNRALFEDRLSNAIARFGPDASLAVVFLSLDGFEAVLDSFGHSEADKIVQEIAARISSVVPKEACLARLQADDFAFFVCEGSDAEAIRLLGEQIHGTLRQPLECSGTEVFLAASIGVSVFPEDGVSTPELMKNAGHALHAARETGGNTAHFYSNGCNARLESRLRLEAELRRAFERNEFVVHYQPKVSVSTGTITGVEALVRWQHPEKGLISPTEFIKVTEDTGLIVPLGELVLRTACEDGARWHSAGFPVEIAVNVSTRQLKQGDLAERFEMILRETGFSPHHLYLEVTESSMIENAETSVAILERLRMLGIGVSLDDFGTGYSSLSHLRILPIDQLKIDREFVGDISSVDGEDDAVLTRVIVSLAQNLGLKVVAEGVENEAQLTFLRTIGCHDYQGFYFSKPLPGGEIADILCGKSELVQGSQRRLSILPHLSLAAEGN